MKTLLLIFCLLTAISARTMAQSLDYKILEEWNIEDDTRGLEGTFRFFSNGNTFFIIGAPVLLLSDGFYNKDPRMIKAGKDALVSLGISTVATWVLKYSIKRERPFEKYPNVLKLSNGGGSSFPSGHTSSAF